MTFNNFNLSSPIVEALDKIGYHKPTKVQEKVIPMILDGDDLIVQSQTGSGKTAAFGIPMCHFVEWDENKPQVLVITPTRELAVQVKEELFHIGRYKRLKVAAVYGKSSFERQQKEIKQKTHIVCGTPGRMIDHMQKETLDVSNVKYLVIDEADEMLNMGFIDQLRTLIDMLPDQKKMLLFSATMPEEIADLAKDYMDSPKLIQIEASESTKPKIDDRMIRVEHCDKQDLLEDLTVIHNPDTCIVFCNTQMRVDRVYHDLKEEGYRVDKIHGGMQQEMRLKVMRQFKRGDFRYLIATDVASRGIDVEKINLVINYDCPEDSESYVHRIGRTGRKGETGIAYTFITEDDDYYLEKIEDLIERTIPVEGKPSETAVSESMEAFVEKMRRRPEKKTSKSNALDQGIMKLHINAGKKQKMRPVDIVGTLCAIEGMTADDIGIINIIDISTFVEILNGKGPMVLKALQNKTLKGRIRRVSKAGDPRY